MERAKETLAFEGRVVLVTGASSGIGDAIVEAFEREGATVVAVARTERMLASARPRHPNARWIWADVAKAEEVRAAVEAVLRDTARLDVVVNNAGVFEFAPLEGSSEELIRRHFEINVYGTTFVAQAALPALRASHGTIVNISSAAGHKPAPGGGHYAASKAAVESLTQSWALELAPHGVRVNAIAPGPVDTPGFDKAGLPPETVAAVKASFVKQVPLGRMGGPEEVARWVLALADPSATWVTGQIISIDGGMSLT
jgi:NAD(P)-dependent dehydrogenase (short-subunit alcohol dehydrogenase family)